MLVRIQPGAPLILGANSLRMPSWLLRDRLRSRALASDLRGAHKPAVHIHGVPIRASSRLQDATDRFAVA